MERGEFIKVSALVAGALAWASCVLPVQAQIELGAPFTDGVVLQRECDVPVWGKAAPGRKVTVVFAGVEASVVVGADGCWRAKLQPMAASAENRTMTVVESENAGGGSTTDKVEIHNVLVGEVWFASGQSNMDCPLWYGGHARYRDGNGALVASMTRLPQVRFFKSPQNWSLEPKPIKTVWREMTAVNLVATKFSAVGFYYARELYLALQIPIGIVDASIGGTNIDAWTPRCGYTDCDPSIADTANFKLKQDFDPVKDRVGPISKGLQQPTVLWNAMVDAFAPMAIRGFIWYQGCHNNSEAHRYRAKLHALYNGWSRRFENPALKFYLVGLAPYRTSWMRIFEAQSQFVKEQPNAALAVTADVGNFDDIHPNEKEIVAKRLAVHALKRDYGFDIAEDNSPCFKSATFKDGKAIVEFEHATSLYVYSRDRSHDTAFELAGADGIWKSAKILNFGPAKDKFGKPIVGDYIKGSALELQSEDVPEPVKVRYLGEPRTMGTVYNQAALPLGPFEMK